LDFPQQAEARVTVTSGSNEAASARDELAQARAALTAALWDETFIEEELARLSEPAAGLRREEQLRTAMALAQDADIDRIQIDVNDGFREFALVRTERTWAGTARTEEVEITIVSHEIAPEELRLTPITDPGSLS
jgi:hypothetical protein